MHINVRGQWVPIIFSLEGRGLRLLTISTKILVKFGRFGSSKHYRANPRMYPFLPLPPPSCPRSMIWNLRQLHVLPSILSKSTSIFLFAYYCQFLTVYFLRSVPKIRTVPLKKSRQHTFCHLLFCQTGTHTYWRSTYIWWFKAKYGPKCFIHSIS